MIRILLATVLATALAAPASAAPDVLSRLVRSRETSAYRGEQIIATWDGEQTRATLVRIEHDPPGWTRLEYRPVGSTARRVILRRGATEIQYDPATMEGTARRRGAASDDDVETTHLAWLRENYRMTVSPAQILGRPAQRVDLAPRTGDRPRRRLYVDDATGTILRSERATADGRLGEVSAFIVFEPMPRGWRAGVTPPPRLKLAVEPEPRPVTPGEAARIAGRAPVAFSAPSGFHLLGLFRLDRTPPVFQSVYSDGLSTLVLTQRPGLAPRPPQESRLVETGGGPVWLHTIGLRTLAHWTSSGWLLTLVGDVTPEAMVTAARQTGVSPPPRLLDRLLHWVSSLRRSLP